MIKKGSTAWYKAMNLRLLRHADGFHSVNSYAKLQHSYSLSQKIDALLSRFRSANDDIDREIQKTNEMLNSFTEEHLQHLQIRIKKYLS